VESHGDRITKLPKVLSRWRAAATSLRGDGRYEAKYFGVQFHPEVHHTPNGEKLLEHFAVDICGAKPNWTPKSIIEEAVERIQKQVGNEPFDKAQGPRVLAAFRAGSIHRSRRRWRIRRSRTTHRGSSWIPPAAEERGEQSLRRFGIICTRN